MVDMMKVMVAGRQHGKTTSLVEAMRWKPEAVLVVHTNEYAAVIENEYPFLRGRVYGPNKGVLRGLDRPVCVDNIDLILADLLHPRIVAGTMTGRLIK